MEPEKRRDMQNKSTHCDRACITSHVQHVAAHKQNEFHMSAINFTVSNSSINALRAERDMLRSKIDLTAEEMIQLASVCDLLFAMRRAYHSARTLRTQLALASK